MNNKSALLSTTVLVSALGYFVDIYDLLLFGIVRVKSLEALGFSGQAVFDQGVILLNCQMIGLLVGGILWGVLGDRKGRLSVLFGSIFLYSIANIANAFVIQLSGIIPGTTPIQLYWVLRFIAGVGLAGELGAAITLVSESLPKDLRGYGTAIVAGVGVSGAVVAAFVGKYFAWNIAYLTGGGLGLALLITRVSLLESGMYRSIHDSAVSRGNFFSLFTSIGRFRRFLCSILIGVPLWFAIGILVTLSPELSTQLGVTGKIAAGESIKYCYMGLVLGDLASGFLSQYFKSRKRVIFAFQTGTLVLATVYVRSFGISPTLFYTLCFLIGCTSGYWAVFVTVAAEQFGTNLRATVATSVPNFVRASVVPLTFGMTWLNKQVGLNLLTSAYIVGMTAGLVAYIALFLLEETHGKNLDFVEN